MTVYIVDDDPIMAATLTRFVEDAGHYTRTFYSANEAWEAHQSEPANLIFSDWKMAGLNGLDLCTKVRSNPTQYTYFILFTGVYTSQKDYLQGIEAGADTFMRKPISYEEVQGRLLAAKRILYHTKGHNLQPILRTCSFCKDVSPSDDEWESLETFVRKRLGFQFSHGVCPTCFPKWLKSFRDDSDSDDLNSET